MVTQVVPPECVVAVDSDAHDVNQNARLPQISEIESFINNFKATFGKLQINATTSNAQGNSVQDDIAVDKPAKECLNSGSENAAQDSENELKKYDKSAMEDVKSDPNFCKTKSPADLEDGWSNLLPDDHVDSSFSFAEYTDFYYRGLIEMMDANCSDDDDDESNLVCPKDNPPEKVIAKGKLFSWAAIMLEEEEAQEFIMAHGLLKTYF